MARTAQTATAVLGALSIEPMTGYEIRRAVTEVLGHFWHESYGQIYPTLARLTDDGLVRQAQGRYVITAAGRRELRTRLLERTEPTPPRNGTLLRVFFGAHLTDQALVELLDDHASQARARLAELQAIREQLESEDEFAVHRPYWLATIRAGELAAQAQLDWVHETCGSLRL